ncbi:MAG: protein kinase [Chitinivibrionales bacterium]|nr:protein kinase [Chitinivibrionales bacterium]
MSDSSTSESRGHRLPPGQMPHAIGRYRVTDYVGSGGMGDVWRGLDEYGSEVAIKQLSPGRIEQQRLLRRFLREGEVLARLRHRNICRIHSIEQIDGRPFIVMEYVQGISLARLLQYLSTPTMDETGAPTVVAADDIGTVIEQVAGASEPVDPEPPVAPSADPPRGGKVLPLQQTLTIVMSLCDAVQYAHEQGVFHRDIKPSNVILRGDGEPVLLDFGVAKLIGDQVREQLTITGQLFGTFEYMAPEQALSGKTVDERADVYSLGALLYEMVTGCKHFVSSGAIVTDIDLLSMHEPKPPSRVMHGIDPDLDAIVLKALRPDPGARYRSAMHLGKDLRRYSEGRPVEAKPPTPWYRTTRFVRRHRGPVVLSAIIAGLLVMLGLIAAVDHHRRWGDWREVLAEDFTDGHYEVKRFLFTGMRRTETPPWRCDSIGLVVPNGEWCWLRNVRVSGDVRMVVRMRYGALPDGFEAVINASDDPVERWWHLPRGYGCQVGGYNGTLDFVTNTESPDVARVLNPGISDVKTGETVEVEFQRKGERIELRVNGKLQSVERDAVPFWGPQFGRIGFRSYARELRVLSLRVYHMSLPEKTSPLVVGHALASLGHVPEAVAAYGRLAADHQGTPLEERALFQAIVTAEALPDTQRQTTIDSLTVVFQRRFPHSALWQEVREEEMVFMWRRGRFEEVLLMLPEHYRQHPDTRIAVRLQATPASAAVPDSTRERLFVWVCRTTGATAVDASGLPASAFHLLSQTDIRNLRWQYGALDDLSAVTDLRLQWLVIDNNRIAGLDPLRGHPLRYLYMVHNFVDDLGALQDAPLVSLFASSNRIGDLSPLRSSPLQVLRVANNDIGDLSPLQGLPLEKLFIDHNDITDLSPLRGMQLRELTCQWNRISDFSPLQGMPLERLECGSNQAIELRVLQGMPLKDLGVINLGLRDLSPVASLPLDVLTASRNPLSSLSPIRNMRLTYLGLRGCGLTSVASLAAMHTLRSLDIGENRITDLRPLAGLQLDHVSCVDNPLSSLEPFVHAPPERFAFVGMDVSVEALHQAIEVWSRRPEHGHLAHQARVCLALQENDSRALRALATNAGGNRYLYVPLIRTWEQADSLCRAHGAHLVSVEGAKEERLVQRLKHPLQVVWLGVRPGAQPVQWSTGEPVRYWKGRIDNWSAAPWAYLQEPMLWEEGSRAAILMEWER